MNVQRIEQIAQAEMADFKSDTREPGWILYHGQRTGKLAVLLSQKLNCEVDCNVLFHNQRKKSDSFSDLIDHVGLIDVWMAFYWSGHHGESIHNHIAYYEGEEYRRWRTYMRTHLNYDVSKQMFEERIQWEDDLLARFHKMYFDGI